MDMSFMEKLGKNHLQAENDIVDDNFWPVSTSLDNFW